jgi:hypothetical protein
MGDMLESLELQLVVSQTQWVHMQLAVGSPCSFVDQYTKYDI